MARFARFSLAISEIDRCWHKLAAEEMAKYELNSPHAVYLTTLYHHPEGVTAVKLGDSGYQSGLLHFFSLRRKYAGGSVSSKDTLTREKCVRATE